jgi:hypothetical protein
MSLLDIKNLRVTFDTETGPVQNGWGSSAKAAPARR